MNQAITDVLGRASSDETALRLLFAASAVWLAAAVAAVALRRVSAALRHRIWSMAVVVALMLPAVMLILPERRVGAIRLPAAKSAKVEQTQGVSGPPEQDFALPQYHVEQGPERTAPPTGGQADIVAVDARRAKPAYTATQSQAHVVPTAPPRLRRHVSWRLIFWLTWLIPMLCMMLRQAVAFHFTRLLLNRVDPVKESKVIHRTTRLCNRLGLRKVPRLLTCELLTPVCVGWWNPRILLPRDWQTWPDAQLDAVLTHELAHIARGDVLWQTLARLACAIYWPHPIAWIAAWRMRIERELACDDWVLNGGESSTRYARWLLEVATALVGTPHAAEQVGVAMASRSGFEKRVSAILDSHRARRPISRTWAIGLTVVALVLLTLAGTFSPLAPRKAAAQPQASARPTTAPASQPATNSKDLLHIAGRVQDERGQAMAASVLTLHISNQEQTIRPAADGTFAVDVEARGYGPNFLRATSADAAQQAFVSMPDIDLQKQHLSDMHVVLHPAREFAVTVNDAKGAPVEDALVLADADYAVVGQARTDSAGKATLRVAREAPMMLVLAAKPLVGLDYFAFWRKGAPHTNPYQLEENFSGPLKFELNGAIPVKVRVIDEQGQPMAGVTVEPWYFEKPRRGAIANVSGIFLPLFKQETNAKGIAEFSCVPADNSSSLNFWTRLPGYSAPDRWMFDPKSGKTEIVAKLLKQVRGTGRVLGPDGSGAGDVEVKVVGGNPTPYGDFRQEARTAADGSFEVQLDQSKYYAIVAQRGDLISPIVHRTILEKALADPIELNLSSATHVTGKATAGTANAPLPNAQISFSLRDNSYYQLPRDQQLLGNTPGTRAVQPSLGWNTTTDANGNFDLYLAPGEYGAWLYVGAITVSQQPRIAGAQVEVDFHADQMTTEPNMLKGRIVLADQPNAAVAEAVISGAGLDLDTRIYNVTADAQGNFLAHRGKDDLYLMAASPDKSLIGLTRVKSTDATVTLPVGKTGVARGRLVDGKGIPLPGEQIDFGIGIHTPRGMSQLAFSQSAKTDAAGNFVLTGLVPGFDYEMNIVRSFGDDGRANGWRTIGSAKVGGAFTSNLGDVTYVAPTPPKTWRDYLNDAFNEKQPFADGLSEAKITARLSYQNVMVLLGSPKEPACQQFFEYRYDRDGDNSVWNAMIEHVLIVADTATAPAALREWAQSIMLQWPSSGMTLAILDMDGKLLGQASAADLSTDGKLDRAKLIAFARKHALVKPDARKLLDDALARANRENKLTLLDESGPYCPWCVLLSKYIESNQPLIDKAFVCVTLDRRFEHGTEILQALHAKDFSTPWMAVLAPDGHTLSTSDAAGENFGYPDTAAGRLQWEKMLRTSPRLTDGDIKQLLAAATRN